MENILIISFSVSVVILLFMLVNFVLKNHYSAVCRYYIWLIIAVRLLIPFRFELPDAPVKIQNTGTIVLRTDGNSILEYYNDYSYIEKGNNSHDSANYAPVITLKGLMFSVWVIGMAAVLIYHGMSYINFKRKIGRNLKKKEDFVYICDDISTPMMLGFVKRMILLPDKSYSNDELEVIMKHEMTHWRRHDIWYKLLLVIVSAVHWFNPIVHLMVRCASRDLEYSCDEIVVKNTDSEYKKNYASVILKTMRGDEL